MRALQRSRNAIRGLVSGTKRSKPGKRDDDSLHSGWDNETAAGSQIDEERTVVGGSEVGDDFNNERLDQIKRLIDIKYDGALVFSIVINPNAGTARVVVQPGWVNGELGSVSKVQRGQLDAVVIAHPALALYRRERFMKSTTYKYSASTDEDYFFLSAEGDPEYESIYPGTVTVEGFGLECSEYERDFGQYPEHQVVMPEIEIPTCTPSWIYRRIQELANGPRAIGLDPQQDIVDLGSIVGNMGFHLAADARLQLSRLYSMLNRLNLDPSNFIEEGVLPLLAGHGADTWNIMYNSIFAQELARRLTLHGDAGVEGFTTDVLYHLTLADRWIKHVSYSFKKVDPTEENLVAQEFSKQELPSADGIAKAAALNKEGNIAMSRGAYGDAANLFNEATLSYPGNSIYHINRAEALLEANAHLEVAHRVAWLVTQQETVSSRAWCVYARTQLATGKPDGAILSLEKAIAASEYGNTDAMNALLSEARMMIAARDKIHIETNTHAPNGADPITEGNRMFLDSAVHKRQVEGLLLFAERLQWPWLEETRAYAENVYPSLQSMIFINHTDKASKLLPSLFDWMYGMTMPGNDTAVKLMSVLVACTPAIANLGKAPHSECGVSLPIMSYWRTQTVVGRVLGCLPNKTSICGWIGPLPKVKVVRDDGSIVNPESYLPAATRYYRVAERRLQPIQSPLLAWPDRYEQPGLGREVNETLLMYAQDLENEASWSIPQPPAAQNSSCTVEYVLLNELPLDTDGYVSRNNLTEDDIQSKASFRASIVLKIDADAPITFRLHTRPVFVTLPNCNAGQNEGHQVHRRELPRFKSNIWTVKELRELRSGDAQRDDVMVINATGDGCEVAARAWCSERGKCAVVRRSPGPCYTCAYRAAGKHKDGMGLGVLIWVS